MYKKAQPSSSQEQDEKIAELKAQIKVLEKEIGPHNPDTLVKEHIRLLHRYNEVKDTTQSLIYQYAIMTNTTVTAVHQELDLPLKE